MSKMFRKRTLQVEVTTFCNLDCSICLRGRVDRPNRMLSFTDFRRIFDPSICNYVGLHGWGEPLLNPELFEMIAYARSHRVVVNLTTNGTLLRERGEEILRSGLEEIAFGVYDPKLLLNCLPAIQWFIRERNKRGLKTPRTYLDVTLHQGTRNSIRDLVQLASKAGIEAVIVHRLFDLYGVGSVAKCVSADDERELFAQLREVARSSKIKLYLPVKHSYPCRIVRRSVFVTVEGNITPCTYLIEEHLGSAVEQGVGKALKSTQYKGFLKRMKDHPVCSKCRW
ncbi:MAG: radical SAM protein [Deltaproteobacteria bacterium]|nr:radical SAM protein [Deltaproteobacteria bacterium]